MATEVPRRTRLVGRIRTWRNRSLGERRSMLVWAVGVTALVVLLGFFLSWRWFVRPTTDTPDQADAVVVFAGGRGERLATAVELMERGVADHLVLPNGNLPHWDAANELCSGDYGFEVHCFTPDPDDTWGEAAGIGRLADVHDWQVVVAVTSTYHVSRVRTLLDRCVDGTVQMVAASPGLDTWDWSTRIAHEWAGVIAAHTWRRSC